MRYDEAKELHDAAVVNLNKAREQLPKCEYSGRVLAHVTPQGFFEFNGGMGRPQACTVRDWLISLELGEAGEDTDERK